MKSKSAEKHSQSVWFILSLSLHMVVLACLFISLVHKPSLLRKEKQPLKTFPVPAPVVFYGHQMDPLKKPGSMALATPAQPQPSAQKAPPPPAPTKKEVETAPQKTVPNQNKETLTLKDIFNHARKTFASNPHISDLQAPGDAAGQPIVIREGDMKYYSLWAGFLKHLNSTARFNRVQKPVPIAEWIKSKKIKQNMQCGITINKKGEVQAIDITISSGYTEFDQLCIEDIWSASPFPPLPDQLGKTVARFEVKSYL